MPSAITDVLITCVFLWATIKARAFKKQRETLDFHSRLPLNFFRALAASWVIYNSHRFTTQSRPLNLLTGKVFVPDVWVFDTLSMVDCSSIIYRDAKTAVDYTTNRDDGNWDCIVLGSICEQNDRFMSRTRRFVTKVGRFVSNVVHCHFLNILLERPHYTSKKEQCRKTKRRIPVATVIL